MLREIEVRNMEVGDIKLRPERAVTIAGVKVRPAGHGMGVRRTLKCNCRDSCFDWFPLEVGSRARHGRQAFRACLWTLGCFEASEGPAHQRPEP